MTPDTTLHLLPLAPALVFLAVAIASLASDVARFAQGLDQ